MIDNYQFFPFILVVMALYKGCLYTNTGKGPRINLCR